MNEIDIILSEDAMQSPNELAKKIVQLADDIDSCKDDLTQIMDRGWFKRITNNNTRDLAYMQIKQNKSMSLLLMITKESIFHNFNNTVFLGALYEQICKEEKARGNFSCNYLNMAKEFISATLTSSKKHFKRIEDLEEIASDLVKKYNEKEQLDQEQNRRLNEIDGSMSKKNVIDDEQSKAINKLVQYLRKKDEIDHKQTSDVVNLAKRITDLETSDANNKNSKTIILLYIALGLSVTSLIFSLLVFR